MLIAMLDAITHSSGDFLLLLQGRSTVDQFIESIALPLQRLNKEPFAVKYEGDFKMLKVVDSSVRGGHSNKSPTLTGVVH